MKNIDASIEWYRSNQGHCDALIKDIVLLGNKGDGEDKEDRSHQEDRFIDDLETLRGCLEIFKTNGDLPSKLQETNTVLEILSNWGLENNANTTCYTTATFQLFIHSIYSSALTTPAHCDTSLDAQSRCAGAVRA